MVAIVLLGVTLGRGRGTGPVLATLPAHGDLEAFLTAVVPVMMAYNGFGILGHVGGEVLNARKNLPRAAILGASLVVGLYVLYQLGLLSCTWGFPSSAV